MKKLIFSLLFLSSLSVLGQNAWNELSSKLNVIPSPTYDSTFILKSPSRDLLGKGIARWETLPSEYVALITQSGINDPVAIVLNNTTGISCIWDRTGIGSYTGTFSGLDVDINKVFFQAPSTELNNQFAYDIAVTKDGDDLTVSIHSYDMGSNSGVVPFTNIDDAMTASIPYTLKLTIYQ